MSARVNTEPSGPPALMLWPHTRGARLTAVVAWSMRRAGAASPCTHTSPAPPPAADTSSVKAVLAAASYRAAWPPARCRARGYLG